MDTDERLTELIGRWSGEEDVSATAWTAAGRADARLTIDAGPGGVLLDYDETRSDGQMTAHGVVSGTGWWWFDSYGFSPSSPGMAMWDDGVLTLERRSDRGRNVMTLSREGETLRMRLSAATPADAPLALLVEGVYTRDSDAE